MEVLESQQINVLIVEDELEFRELLTFLLEPFAERVTISGQASNAAEAIERVQEQVPDVVFLDLRLPLDKSDFNPDEERGIALISQIRQIAPHTRVLVLSSFGDDPENDRHRQTVFRALQEGAHGYMTKGESFRGRDLLEASQRLLRGEAIYGPAIAKLIREHFQGMIAESQPTEQLSPREDEVLTALASDTPVQEVASSLGIPLRAVNIHASNILAKIHRRTLLKAVVAATAMIAASNLNMPEIAATAELEQAAQRVRISCFYQLSQQAIPFYTDAHDGLPNDAQHVHIFSHSQTTGLANPQDAALIHAGGTSFKYAPAFDLNNYAGWRTAGDDQLRRWAWEFRDTALRYKADYFGFNELYSDIPTKPEVRGKIMTLLRHLSTPDGAGRRLYGVLFMIEAAATPTNWTSPANEFWQAVNQTCVLVVAEHYHSYSFMCQNNEGQLAQHLFAMREWLNSSNDTAKKQIANNKFTVLHSSYYGQTPGGWHGCDSDSGVTIRQCLRSLSKAAKVTRNTAGGFNRIAFGPLSVTDERVHPHLRMLVKWHFNQGGSSRELHCVDGADINCQC